MISRRMNSAKSFLGGGDTRLFQPSLAAFHLSSKTPNICCKQIVWNRKRRKMPVQTSDIFQALTNSLVCWFNNLKKLNNTYCTIIMTQISRQAKFSVFFHSLHCHCTIVNSLLLSRKTYHVPKACSLFWKLSFLTFCDFCSKLCCCCCCCCHTSWVLHVSLLIFSLLVCPLLFYKTARLQHHWKQKKMNDSDLGLNLKKMGTFWYGYSTPWLGMAVTRDVISLVCPRLHMPSVSSAKAAVVVWVRSTPWEENPIVETLYTPEPKIICIFIYSEVKNMGNALTKRKQGTDTKKDSTLWQCS